jgi:hypothetical protein
LTLCLSNFSTENVMVTIHNIYGKKYYENSLNIHTTNTHELNVENLSNGIYLLHVWNNEGVNVTRYLIKN